MTDNLSVEEYKSLYHKKKRQQPEGKLQINLGKLLNGVWRYRLNPNLIFWTYSGAGERKDKKGALWQFLKGLKKGDLDYRFHLAENGDLRMVFLETKSSKGSLTPDQKIFIEKHKNLRNASCGIVQDILEAQEFLEKERVLIKN